MKIELTHKGWFGVCPVYFGNLQSEAPLVVERHVLLTPLMMFSELAFSIAMMFCDGPQWPLMVTGEIPPGLALDVPE